MPNYDSWEQISTGTTMSARRLHRTVAHNGYLYVVGGNSGGDNRASGVWRSDDGVSWTQLTESGLGLGRAGHALVTDGSQYMYAYGGSWDSDYAGIQFLNDVWRSEDGITWTEMTNSAPWAGRHEFGYCYYSGLMWVLGGFNGTYYNDVWSSPDGSGWTQVTSNAAWSIRREHTVGVYDNKMWVLGGDPSAVVYASDVWSSTNGSGWTEVTSSANWSDRKELQTFNFDDKMWIIGGYDGSAKDDTWYTTDGSSWTEFIASGSLWAGRSDQSATIFKNGIYLIHGWDDPTLYNDVWLMQLAAYNPSASAPTQRAVGPIRVVLTNQRVSPYKSGIDNIQAKVAVYRRNRLINQADLPIELWLNYLGVWHNWEDYTTNRFGTKNIHYECNYVPRIDNCLGFARVTWQGKEYDSNIVRFNFIFGQSPDSYIDFIIDADVVGTDRSLFDIFDGSERTNRYDRMF